MQKDKLNISEMFLSHQGEGSSQGRLSLFLRLQSCNLLCGGVGTEKDKLLIAIISWSPF